MVKRKFLAVFALIVAVQIVSAQKRTGTARPIKVKVDRVVIPVTVTNEMGGAIIGLDKKNFEIYEDKKPQNIISLEGTDSEISIGIILDVSGSMQYKLSEAARALVEFMKTANPKDEFLLITLADRPHFNLGFTQNYPELQKKLLFLKAEGSTALLDAAYLGIHEVKKGKYPRKAILIISDGGDNHSRYSQKEIKNLVKESDTMLYAIGIYNRDVYNGDLKEFRNLAPFTVKAEMLEILRSAFLLDEITRISGGKFFIFVTTQQSPGNLSLSDVARQISLELRNQYLLTYRSTNEKRDGKWRKVKVKLADIPGSQDFIVRHKKGYFAPEN